MVVAVDRRSHRLGDRRHQCDAIERFRYGWRIGPGRCAPAARIGVAANEDDRKGSSLLIAGVAGTGKTVLLLEFLYRGAQAGEKGIIFSFEETEERLRAAAKGLGWDLDREIRRGMVEIVFTAQPDILVEKHLLMMRERVEAMQARRVAIDSVSVFLHKIKDPQINREKIFQLASIVQNVQAVGFFATDIPYGADQLSRFGVEETVVDGVVLLSSKEEQLERRRYIEVYKLRNTAHLKGRHSMTIGPDGIAVFPRYNADADVLEPPPFLEPSHRISSGVPGLDQLCGGGLIERSVTLVSGSAGIGKSTLGLQFIAEGAKQGDRGLYVSLEEGPEQILRASKALGLPLEKAVAAGLCEVVYLSRDLISGSQLLEIISAKLEAQETRRLTIDGASQVAIGGEPTEDLRTLLFALVRRVKMLGATSILTVEASSMYATGRVTDQSFSPVADNIVLLRYVQCSGENRPSLAVVKTRGSPHDRGTYYFSIAKGGIRLEERVDAGDRKQKRR